MGPSGDGECSGRANERLAGRDQRARRDSIRPVALSGDGLAAGEDLVEVARSAVSDALVPLGGATPDLLVVFVSGEDDPDITAAALVAAHEAAGARHSLGCSAMGVIGAGCAVSDRPAVSAWAAVLPGARIRSFHLEVLRTRDAWAVVGMPVPRSGDVVGTLFADPWSFPVEGFVGAAGGSTASLQLAGGMAHGEHGAGSTRLMVDGVVHGRGAVGAVLSGVEAFPLVDAGHRPFGPPMTVTASYGSVIAELAGVPAAQKLSDAVALLSDADRELADRGVVLGVAVAEYVDDPGAGELVTRSILDIDQVRESIEVPDPLAVGTTVRFCLPDPYTASDGFTDALVGLRASAGTGPLDGALMMACADRYADDEQLLDDDLRAMRRVLGVSGIAGMMTAGEIGPMRGANHLHGLSATLLAMRAGHVIDVSDGAGEIAGEAEGSRPNAPGAVTG